MIPNLALIVTVYVVYRLIETTVRAYQRNKTVGVVLGVVAGICGLLVCGFAYDIVNTASHTSNPLSQ